MPGQSPKNKFDPLADDSEGSEEKPTAPGPAQSNAAIALAPPAVNPGGYQTIAQHFAAIPQHTSLHPNPDHTDGAILRIELDLRPTQTQYWKRTLLASLQEYRSLCKIVNIELFPHHDIANWAWRRTGGILNPFQNDFLKQVVDILNEWTTMDYIKVLLHSPPRDWDIVQSLAPFYRLRYDHWICATKEEGKPEVALRDDMDKRLRELLRDVDT